VPRIRRGKGAREQARPDRTQKGNGQPPRSASKPALERKFLNACWLYSAGRLGSSASAPAGAGVSPEALSELCLPAVAKAGVSFLRQRKKHAVSSHSKAAAAHLDDLLDEAHHCRQTLDEHCV
jgi:hypothetical protein